MSAVFLSSQVTNNNFRKTRGAHLNKRLLEEITYRIYTTQSPYVLNVAFNQSVYYNPKDAMVFKKMKLPFIKYTRGYHYPAFHC